MLARSLAGKDISRVESISPFEEIMSTKARLKAHVTVQGVRCLILISQDPTVVTIMAAKDHKEQHVFLRLPSFLLLNVESKEERADRERVRGSSDAEARKMFGKALYTSTAAGHPRSHYNYGASAHHSSETCSCSPSVDSEKSKKSSKASHHLYYLHYICMNSKAKGKSINTLEVEVASEDYDEFSILCSHLISIVYGNTIRKLVIFVSPTSGSGKAASVARQAIVPVLHFSKHSFKVITTTRAHHCEDYVADLNAEINEHYVLVVVGGDGMIHEVVNGLHRRKLAYIDQYLEKHKGNPTTHSSLSSFHANSAAAAGDAAASPSLVTLLQKWEETQPVVSTVPAGSGCGLAKSLDFLSPLDGVLALIRCRTVSADLFRMQFAPSSTLIQNNKAKLTPQSLRRILKKFSRYQDANQHELDVFDEEKAVLQPFLANHEYRYADPVSFSLKAPNYAERIGFLSLSIGMTNEIDKGSETIRWMGNARFTVYGGLSVLKGVSTFHVKLRYLPWKAYNEETIEMTKEGELKNPSVPFCTHRDDCGFCLKNSASQPYLGSPRIGAGNQSPAFINDIDFDDLSLPWKTIEEDVQLLMACGVRHIAQDIIMAPLAHVGDGAIDIVYALGGKKYGRMAFLDVISSLEKGEHLKKPSVCYLKAAAVEIETDSGFIMADGEMMPMSRIRMTKIRKGVQFVHGI